MTSIGRVFPLAVVLQMNCRNSYPIDGVKCTRVGPTLAAGLILMGGKPRTDPEQDRVLAQGRSSGACQRLKSDIYLSLSFWHSTSITNFPRENILTEGFSLTILSFTFLILLNYYLIIILYFECLVRLQP